MAVMQLFPRRLPLFQSFLRTNSWNEISAKNGYSVYPSFYIEPVYKKAQQEALYETGEAAKVIHVPVRPARNDQTSSVFHDTLVRKFTNYVMKGGNKHLARNLMEKAFENIKRIQLSRYNSAKPEERENIEIDPKVILYKAVTNSTPLLELTPIKRGGATYQVPVPLTEKHSQFVAIKWLIAAARDKERTVHLPEKLAWELLDAAQNQGRVIKRKQDMHKQCEANRAYAHYRWS